MTEDSDNQDQVLGDGKHSRLVSSNGWEYVERKNATGIVGIVAVTPEGQLLLVEQFRPPVGRHVIELPAGLAGDSDDTVGEHLAEAARRELEEETGYTASSMVQLSKGPPSAGLSSEVVTFYLARGLKRIGEGGGDGSESITTHFVPLDHADAFLRNALADGRLIDPKVYLGLYFATRPIPPDLPRIPLKPRKQKADNKSQQAETSTQPASTDSAIDEHSTTPQPSDNHPVADAPPGDDSSPATKASSSSSKDDYMAPPTLAEMRAAPEPAEPSSWRSRRDQAAHKDDQTPEPSPGAPERFTRSAAHEDRSATPAEPGQAESSVGIESDEPSEMMEVDVELSEQSIWMADSTSATRSAPPGGQSMQQPSDVKRKQRMSQFAGAMLGFAVGDALGLPFEGLSAKRVDRFLGNGPLKHRLIGGRGMFSDDTEHMCMTAQAWLSSCGRYDKFSSSLAWRLRGWLAAGPTAIGLATLKACLRLWAFQSPAKSGVDSAGNGPAMRAAMLGLVAQDESELRQLVRLSTHITHTDPRAFEGALIIGEAVHYVASRSSSSVQPIDAIPQIMNRVKHVELERNLEAALLHLRRGSEPEAYVRGIGIDKAVSGYICHTVPAALFVWARHPRDYRSAIEEIIRLGGDTDSTAALVGALVGGAVGESGIPQEWLNDIADYPRSTAWVRDLAYRTAEASLVPGRTREQFPPLPISWPAIPPRNLLFASLALGHGVRRLLPPY